MHFTDIMNPHIPFVILSFKCVGKSTNFKMLFQNQDFMAMLG